jgi:hypothetical protein
MSLDAAASRHCSCPHRNAIEAAFDGTLEMLVNGASASRHGRKWLASMQFVHKKIRPPKGDFGHFLSKCIQS